MTPCLRQAAKERDEEVRTRSEVRAEERLLRWADHQRHTVHDLQDALKVLLSASLAVAFPDGGVARRSSVMILHESSAKVDLLTQRVDDPGARASVDQAVSTIGAMLAGVEPMKLVQRAHAALDAAQRSLASAARSLP